MTERMGPTKRWYMESFDPPSEAPFPLEEYGDRWARTRAAMQAAGVDCLLLSAPESMCHLTGYAAEWYQANGPRDWVPGSCVALHVDHDEPIQFDDPEEVTLIRFTSVARDVRIGPGLGPEMVDFVVDKLKALGWLGGTVGVERRSYRPHPAAAAYVDAALERAGARVVDATSVARGVRRWKSAAELETVREAQRIADVGMAAARDAMAPGVTELEVYGAMVHAMASAGGEVAAIPLPVVSGHRASTVHGLASRRRLEPGDVVNVDVCGVVARYHANMARCFSIGEPSSEVRETIRKVTDAVPLVAGLLRPGLGVRELLETVERYYRDVGLWGEEWWIGGYELGIAFPPDWVGDFFYETGTDPGDEAFRPGDVVNYEANFYLPEAKGLAFCINTMAFDDGRAGFLQSTPPDLIVIDA
jgi:Xaa-Pro aminopeptidase